MRALGSRLTGFSTGILCLGLASCQELSQPDLPGGGPAFAAEEHETTVEVIIEDFITGFPCVGEEIHLTGTARIVHHETTNRGAPTEPGFQHLVEVRSVQLTGTGLSSGDSYRLTDVSIRPLQSPDPQEPLPTVNKFVAHSRLIGPTGAIALVTFSFNVVTNATGEVVVDDFQFEGVCR